MVSIGYNFPPSSIQDQQICAGFHVTGSEDPFDCAVLGYGDSGGPLVCPSREHDGNWTVIGVVSDEDFCVQDLYTPGIYARVQSMRQWIVDTMENN